MGLRGQSFPFGDFDFFPLLSSASHELSLTGTLDSEKNVGKGDKGCAKIVRAGKKNWWGAITGEKSMERR